MSLIAMFDVLEDEKRMGKHSDFTSSWHTVHEANAQSRQKAWSFKLHNRFQ
jgi:hypothetical protein